MFLIHLIFLLNYDLSIDIKKKKKQSFLFIFKITKITLNEPVDPTLILAVDANEPILGWRLKLVSLP